MCARLVETWTQGNNVYTIYMYGALKIELVNDLIYKVKQHRKKDELFIFHHRKHEKLSRRLDV